MAKSEKHSVRERIATALLFQRLGLEGEWSDPDFHIDLPTSLPPNKGHRLSPGDARSMECGLTRLVEMGCQKNALYWCIGRLGKEAEDARQGEKLIVKINDDEWKVQETRVKPAMATRQDMLGLINKARATAKLVQKYRSELLLVADACVDSIDPPTGAFSGPEMAEESMTILLSSLGWIQQLASNWESPNPTALMKSKGVLFPLSYVWLSTQNHGGSLTSKRSSAKQKSAWYRLPKRAARDLAEIAHLYAGYDFTGEDLNDKLQDFAARNPTTFSDLLALAGTLHKAAATQSHD